MNSGNRGSRDRVRDLRRVEKGVGRFRLEKTMLQQRGGRNFSGVVVDMVWAGIVNGLVI